MSHLLIAMASNDHRNWAICCSYSSNSSFFYDILIYQCLGNKQLSHLVLWGAFVCPDVVCSNSSPTQYRGRGKMLKPFSLFEENKYTSTFVEHQPTIQHITKFQSTIQFTNLVHNTHKYYINGPQNCFTTLTYPTIV